MIHSIIWKFSLININFDQNPIPVVDDFQVRWTGDIFAPVSGLYNFRTHSDDGVRLFVNGNLVRTFTFKKTIPTYNLGDLITIGSNNGLSGAIANIRYYKKNLSKHEIATIYNMLMNKNPPVNNL